MGTFKLVISSYGTNLMECHTHTSNRTSLTKCLNSMEYACLLMGSNFGLNSSLKENLERAV